MVRTPTDIEAVIPAAFCWSKFGTEAGESAAAIRQRKEAERQAGDGVFLWGIGNSVGPSIELLLEHHEPEVLFTPMLARPARHDVFPERVVTWRRGVGLDGRWHELPAHSIVTSRVPAGRRARHHYALVCHASDPIDLDGCFATFAREDVVNLRSGAPVGSSQVTSVVRRHITPEAAFSPRYSVAFRATLVAPFLLRLVEGDCDQPLLW